ncbi:lycopene cyclase domain-containing protein [Flavobacterium hauense]
MRQYTYLLINFLTIIICFIFSFHPKIKFDRYFSSFIKASVLVAIPFIIWDAWFTHSGVWWFSDEYLLGIGLLGMPVEEWLFFICIPFSCIFTYYCLNKFFDMKWAEKYSRFLAILIIAICAVTLFLFNDRLYTLITAVVTILTVIYLCFIVRSSSFGKSTLVYIVLMLGFIPVNGTLTGTGLEKAIVNYNPQEIIGFRILTIPIEDFFYGYVLFLLNIYLFEAFTGSGSSSVRKLKISE